MSGLHFTLQQPGIDELNFVSSLEWGVMKRVRSLLFAQKLRRSKKVQTRWIAQSLIPLTSGREKV